MDEAKSLTHMAIAAMIAAAFLAAVFGLINLGRSMWRSMSQEDEANSKISTYANYCAYDNKVVRAQDIIQVMEEHYNDIWVAIYDSPDTTKFVVEDRTLQKMPGFSGGISAPLFYMYNPDGYTGSSMISEDSYTSNTIPVLDTALQAFSTTFNGNSVKDAFDNAAGNSNMLQAGNGDHGVANPDSTGNFYALAANGQFEALQSVFLNNNKLCRLTRRDATNNKEITYGIGYYAPFLSMLVYENDNTTDVAGIIFIRESASVNPEAVSESK